MNRRPPFVWITASCLAILFPLLIHADEGVELRRHWVTGKKYYRVIRVDQELKMSFGETSLRQTIVNEIDTSEAVSPRADGKGKQVKFKYERFLMDMDQNGKKTHFDSSEADAEGTQNPSYDAMSKLVGREFSAVLNDQDEVTGMEKGDTGLEPAKLDAMLDIMKKSGLQSFPDHPVKPGDHWPFESTVNLPQIGKVAVKGTYTMQRMTDHEGVSCAELGIDGEFSLDLAAAEKTSKLSRMGAKLNKASMKGTLWFDPKLGVLRDSRIDQEMMMEMKDPKNSDAPPMSIPIKQVLTAKLSKIEDVK